jgi:hypothetical protein
MESNPRNWAAFLGLAWLALAVLLPACVPSAESAAPRSAALSLLALGDTGESVGPVPVMSPQYRVASALRVADRAAPVDGLVLLGDNFYPDGLKERKFKKRVRENLVNPYCHFIELTSRGRGSMGDGCGDAEHPVPFFAVLGNHDYRERESPMLQRRRIPEYIENWHMPGGIAEAFELPGGVSLVLMQSMEVLRGEGLDELAKVLRSTKGPWRILAGHHPIEDPGDGGDASYTRIVRRVLEESGVAVHVFLAGHEHNLQLLAGTATPIPLHVVAGSGADPHDLGATNADRRAGFDELGFARLDVIGEGGGARIEATLFGLQRDWLGRTRPRFLAGVVLRSDGSLEEASSADVSVQGLPSRETIVAGTGQESRRTRR